MKTWRKNIASISGALILSTCLAQSTGFASEFTAAEKPVYMVTKGTHHFDNNGVSISFTRSQNGMLYLFDENGEQVLVCQGNQAASDQDAVYEITRLDMQNPNRTFFIFNSTIGIHPMNTGFWIIGKDNGTWKTFMTRESLSSAGYDRSLPQRLSIEAPGGEAIYLTSKHEGMPDPGQNMTQAKLTTVFRAGIRWDDSAHKFNVYSLSQSSSADTVKSTKSKKSNATSSSSSRINQYSPRMSMDQARIGGIGIGDSVDYVKSIYGEPTFIGDRGKNYLYDGLYSYNMKYGDSFTLSVVENSNGTVEIIDIDSNANNGLAMPCGIKVGSQVGDMYKNFGMPWRTISDKNSNHSYIYRTQYSPKVVFRTNQQHIITQITIVGME